MGKQNIDSCFKQVCKASSRHGIWPVIQLSTVTVRWASTALTILGGTHIHPAIYSSFPSFFHTHLNLSLAIHHHSSCLNHKLPCSDFNYFFLWLRLFCCVLLSSPGLFIFMFPVFPGKFLTFVSLTQSLDQPLIQSCDYLYIAQHMASN